MNADTTYVLATANDAALANWRDAIGNRPAHHCGSRADLDRVLEQHRPAQLFLDLSLPGLNGHPGINELLKQHPNSLCLAFAPVPQDNEGLDLLRAGVRAYCNRFIDSNLLGQISQLVARGEVWVGTSLMEALIRRLPANSAPASTDNRLRELTEREQDIAQRVALGESNKVIARDLDIAERTVKAHLTSIFQKTRTKDRLQLALLVKGTAP